MQTLRVSQVRGKHEMDTTEGELACSVDPVDIGQVDIGQVDIGQVDIEHAFFQIHITLLLSRDFKLGLCMMVDTNMD